MGGCGIETDEIHPSCSPGCRNRGCRTDQRPIRGRRGWCSGTSGRTGSAYGSGIVIIQVIIPCVVHDCTITARKKARRHVGFPALVDLPASGNLFFLFLSRQQAGSAFHRNSWRFHLCKLFGPLFPFMPFFTKVCFFFLPVILIE